MRGVRPLIGLQAAITASPGSLLMSSQSKPSYIMNMSAVHMCPISWQDVICIHFSWQDVICVLSHGRLHMCPISWQDDICNHLLWQDVICVLSHNRMSYVSYRITGCHMYPLVLAGCHMCPIFFSSNFPILSTAYVSHRGIFSQRVSY